MRLLLVTVIVLGAGCRSSLHFACTTDDQCTAHAAHGLCVDGGCAFADATCGSGYRFDSSAANGGGTCVDVGDGGTDDLGNRGDTDMTTSPGEAIPAHLVFPLSGSYVTSKRPLLKWTLAADSGTPTVELCSTKSCTGTLATATVDQSGTSARPDSDLPPGVVFWRVRTTTTLGSAYSPTWALGIPTRDAGRTSAWGAMPDFNGDGRSEFVSTAECAPNTGGTASTCNGPGRAYVYANANMGTPTQLAPVSEAKAQFGFRATAIDFDGDGYVDLAVSAPGTTVGGNASNGTVFVFRGGKTGLNTGNPIAINGPDGGLFGYGLGSGDVDGDGYGDLVIGAPIVPVSGGNHGRLYVYFGGPTGPRAQPFAADCPEGGNSFGQNVTVVDLNGDTIGDVVTGSQLVTVNNTTGNRLYVYSGVASGSLSISVASFGAVGQFSVAGDVDGDGYPDLLSTPGGTAYVYKGSQNGMVVPATFVLNEPAEFNNMSVGFAYSGTGTRDLDGDGFDDVVVSVSRTTDGGRVAFYKGGNGALATTPSAYFTASSTMAVPADAGFGSFIASDDLDSNGIGDLIVAAPCANETAATKCDGAGEVFVLYAPGSNGGTSLQNFAVAGLDGPFSQFGFCVL